MLPADSLPALLNPMSVLAMQYDGCAEKFNALTHCGVLLQTRGVQRSQTCQNGTSRASPRRRRTSRVLRCVIASRKRQHRSAALQRSSTQRMAKRAPKLSRMVRWRLIGGQRGLLSHEVRRLGMLRHDRLLKEDQNVDAT